MKIKILNCRDYYSKIREHEISKNPLPNTDQAEIGWNQKRRELVQLLSSFGKHDELGYKGGDFTVGEDCFGYRHLGLALLSWKVLLPGVVAELQNFLLKLKEEYAIKIVLDAPREPMDFFEIFMDKQNVFICVMDKEKNEARQVLSTHPVFSLFELVE